MFKQLRYVVITMRPKQWIKNAFVFAALVFDRQLIALQPLLTTIIAALLFCLVSSLVYIINDLTDIEPDRQHPIKKNRPLASGQLSKQAAVFTAIILALLTFPPAFMLNIGLGLILSLYLLLMLAYSFWFKHIPLVDVLIIAIGFILRVAAGVITIETQRFSPWLFVTTVFLALFIGLGKRRAEIQLLDTDAPSHRRVLEGYGLDFLDQLITIVLSTTLITYCLYTFSAALPLDNNYMMLTIPFVIYGLFRYLYLVRIENHGGAPEEILLTDHPMQAAIFLWGLTVLTILYLL
jgi:4-hydroxybenzoate polyprenyltransferase